MNSRMIYACDVGTTRPRRRGRGNRVVGGAFAWAKVSPDEPGNVRVSQNIEELVKHLRADLKAGRSVALGFEAPLFIPVPTSAENLSRGRVGEKDRSFAAPTGLAVTALALHQAAWILSELRDLADNASVFTTSADDWPPAGSRQVLFCWEAFVSGPAHSEAHVFDAATAALAFLAAESALAGTSAVTCERPLSMIAAAALWSGWVMDLSELKKETIVLKPNAPYRGPIEPV